MVAHLKRCGDARRRPRGDRAGLEVATGIAREDVVRQCLPSVAGGVEPQRMDVDQASVGVHEDDAGRPADPALVDLLVAQRSEALCRGWKIMFLESEVEIAMRPG